MEVLFYDNHLLIAGKEAGMLTQPAEGGAQSLQEELQTWLRKTLHKEGNVFLHPVHRLDRAVSGLVVCARSSKALSRLSASIRDHKFHKTYLCLVEGRPEKQKDLLEHYLSHDDYKANVFDTPLPHTKKGSLHFTVLSHHGACSLLKVELFTGRYHQIRAQLSHIGYPILGDHKYGSKKPFLPGVIALHHAHVEFEHPVKKEVCSFSLRVPSAWQAILDKAKTASKTMDKYTICPRRLT